MPGRCETTIPRSWGYCDQDGSLSRLMILPPKLSQRGRMTNQTAGPKVLRCLSCCNFGSNWIFELQCLSKLCRFASSKRGELQTRQLRTQCLKSKGWPVRPTVASDPMEYPTSKSAKPTEPGVSFRAKYLMCHGNSGQKYCWCHLILGSAGEGRALDKSISSNWRRPTVVEERPPAPYLATEWLFLHESHQLIPALLPYVATQDRR